MDRWPVVAVDPQTNLRGQKSKERQINFEAKTGWQVRSTAEG